MRWSLVAFVVATVLVLLSPSMARAYPTFNNHLPNVEAAGGCDLCHGGSGLTAFGEQSRAVQVNGVSWSRLFCQDADGDGQTNGQELGDPCGLWRRGAEAPRTGDLSDPNDEASSATDPDVGCAAGTASPANCDETDIDEVGDDGCSATGASSMGPMAVLVIGLALAGPTVRRRKRGLPLGTRS